MSILNLPEEVLFVTATLLSSRSICQLSSACVELSKLLHNNNSLWKDKNLIDFSFNSPLKSSKDDYIILYRSIRYKMRVHYIGPDLSKILHRWDMINCLIDKSNSGYESVTGVLLVNACKYNNIKLLRYITTQLKHISTYTLNSSMNEAIINKNMNIIQHLINCGYEDFDYGLETSASHSNLELIGYFIKLGATDLNQALLVAVDDYGFKKDITVVQYLINKGANNIEEALENAVKKPRYYLDLVKYFLEFDNNINYVINALRVCQDKDIVVYLNTMLLRFQSNNNSDCNSDNDSDNDSDDCDN